MMIEGPPELLNAFCRIVRLCEIGEHSLSQFPDKTLKLVEQKGEGESTHYHNGHNKLIINVTRLAAKSPAQQCATLCHEMFHFFHDMHHPAQAKTRRNAFIKKFATEEEEITITGTCESLEKKQTGWDHSLFNENAVLSELGEKGRTNHLAFGETSADPDAAPVRLDVGSTGPFRVPPHLAARMQQRREKKE